jgi:hypothetical protein
MRCRQKHQNPGDVFPVNGSDFHYQLPLGLKAGTLVKLLEFDHGYWKVETMDGQRFRNIFSGRIESGWLYELNGRWLDETDSRIIAAKKAAQARVSYSHVVSTSVPPCLAKKPPTAPPVGASAMQHPRVAKR